MSDPTDAPRTVREKITDGEYETGQSYPSTYIMPFVLRKRGDELTDHELTLLPAARAEWAKTQAAYREQVAAYNRDQADRQERFRVDLLTENGVPPADPFGVKMYGLAWGRAHSAGLDEITSAFEELLPLWELYRDKK